MLIAPLFFILLIIISKTFIKFKTQKELKAFNREKRADKLYLIVSRFLIISLLIAALASPYTVMTIERKGDPNLKILVDESVSFELFDQTVGQDLKEVLGKNIPTIIRTLDFGNSSALGNGIRNNIQGNDNILLVTDGHNNKGWDLGDALLFAKNQRSFVNAIDIQAIKKDAAVIIEGPREVIKQTENEYAAIVTTTSDDFSYHVRVIVDGDELINTNSKGSKSFPFKRIFQEGDHKITTILKVDDTFQDNNIYYKSVRALPRPKILFVSHVASPLFDLLDEVYEVTKVDSLPGTVSAYHAVILNNIPPQELKGDIERMTNYLEDGNGFLYVGGDRTFEYNDHCEQNPNDCLFESLLPVKIGFGGDQEFSGVNIVLVIDMSGSSGEQFSQTFGSEKAAVEKALALEIVDTLDLDDNLAVVSFNTDYRYVSKLTPLFDKPDLNDTIAKLKYGGGTIVASGLGQAFNVLKNAQGSKSVILISDGNTDLTEQSLQLASAMKDSGIVVHTIGVGENTNAAFMEGLARSGGGVYFQPTEAQKIKIALGQGEGDQEVESYHVEILNANSFITYGLEIDAEVTGFNQVVPKASGRTLVTTDLNNPLLSTWRFGLGRVAVMSTDDGFKWSSGLLSKQNSKLLTRTINWAVGDPDRVKSYAVKIQDTTQGESTELRVVTDKRPQLPGYEFAKIEQGNKDAYITDWKASKTGFFRILDKLVAVNYPIELQKVGMNPQLKSNVEAVGGHYFKPDQTDAILDKVIQDSIRIETDHQFYRWPFAIAALLLFLIELTFRRIRESKAYEA